MGTKETTEATFVEGEKKDSKKSSFTSSETTNNVSNEQISKRDFVNDGCSVGELDLNIQGELLEYKKDLCSYKKKIRNKKQCSSLTELQRKNSYSLSKNTLILIEDEINMEEFTFDFDDDIINERKNNSSGFPTKQNINITCSNSKANSFESSCPFERRKEKNNSISSTNNEYFLNIETRKIDEIRRSYISKLIYSGVLTSNERNSYSHNSIIIYDWDDTLLCTSFLTPNGIFDENVQFTEEEKNKMKKLEKKVYSLLSKSIQKGDTYIITNSQPGWVEYSTQKFYPTVSSLLSNITIISARGEYENLYPNNSRMWKIKAFIDMVKSIDCSLVTNIVCVGDSFVEIEAAKALASKFNQAYIKCIKFREVPKPEELDKQLVLFEENFEKIYSQVKNLNIYVEKQEKHI